MINKSANTNVSLLRATFVMVPVSRLVVLVSHWILLVNVCPSLTEADCGFMGIDFSFVALPT
jgi:hypothetical protein